jgi:hypothetical protein
MPPKRALTARIVRVAAAASCLAAVALPAQNLIPNPDFHDSTTGWTLAAGQQLLWDSVLEEGNCAGSGSAQVRSAVSGNNQRAEIVVCVATAGLETLFLQTRSVAVGSFYYGADFFPTTDCSSAAIDGGSSSLEPTPLVWSTVGALFPVPPAAGSAEIFIGALDGVAHKLSIDAVVITGEEAIFLDGFEGNLNGTSAPCRWCVNCVAAE